MTDVSVAIDGLICEQILWLYQLAELPDETTDPFEQRLEINPNLAITYEFPEEPLEAEAEDNHYETFTVETPKLKVRLNLQSVYEDHDGIRNYYNGSTSYKGDYEEFDSWKKEISDAVEAWEQTGKMLLGGTTSVFPDKFVINLVKQTKN